MAEGLGGSSLGPQKGPIEAVLLCATALERRRDLKLDCGGGHTTVLVGHKANMSW